MPELPEVETTRRQVEARCLHRTVVDVRTASDSLVFDGVAATRVQRALKNARVTGVARHGKYFWLELEPGPSLLVHLGMTGAVRFPDAPALELESVAADETWPPRFTKLHLRFDDGTELAYIDPRRFGRLRLRREPRSEAPVSKLGPDPLLSPPDSQTLAARLGRRSGPIKAVLLDQRLFAGVGNWIADEVLYGARIDPRRPARELSPAEVRRLASTLRRVLTKAVAVDADKRRFPRAWLFHRRWNKGMKTPQKTVDGLAIEYVEVGGRTTAWVPERQE